MEKLEDVLSVEMLNDILDIEVEEFTGTYIWGGVHLRYKTELNKEDKVINIYELAHLTKQKAITKGYFMNVLYNEDWWDRVEKPFEVDLYNHRVRFSADRECYAIFKAYKWIYKKEK